MVTVAVNAVACTVCGRSGLGTCGGKCGSCRARAAAEACEDCGKVRQVAKRLEGGGVLCSVCHNRRGSVIRADGLRAEAVSVLARWLPGTDAGLVARAVVVAAPNFRQAEWLRVALTDPGVLRSSTVAPTVVDRLVGELLAGGVDGIGLPCCVRCRRTGWLTQRLDGHRACSICAQKVRLDTCGCCGRLAGVVARGDDGTARCGNCVAQDASRWEPCAHCNRTARPVRCLSDGAALCSACNRKAQIAVCVLCDRERPCDGIASGRPHCAACSRLQAPCSRCGRVAAVMAVWACGPVCSTCRLKGLEAKAVCSGCGQLRRPDPRDRSGRCSDCVGMAPLSVCQTCGLEDRVYRDGQCFRCSMIQRFDTLTSTSAVDLMALCTMLIGSGHPRAVLRWLNTRFVGDPLVRLASGDLAMTHAGLDGLGKSPAIGQLRAVLVSAGLLAARDETVSHLELWIEDQLAAVAHAEDRRVIEAFAHWWVLRRVRRRAQHSETTNTVNARRAVGQAVQFLTFLAEHDRTLATCSQADIELWLAGPAVRRSTGDFVKWAHNRRLCAELRVDKRAQGFPARRITPDSHAEIVRRLLDDTDINLVDRVSGLLVACYGQIPARLALLTIEHVTVSDSKVTIRFGTDDTVLVAPIAELVRTLVDSRRGRAAVTGQSTKQWLFPGGLPGKHIHPATLSTRLRHLGIRAIDLRTAAILDFAADVPPAILADMIGLYPSTAARWTHAAGGDWSLYVASKTRNTTAPTST